MNQKSKILIVGATASALLLSGCAGSTTVKPKGPSQCTKKVISKELGMIACEDKDGIRKWSRPLTNSELNTYLSPSEKQQVLKNRSEEKAKLDKSKGIDTGVAVASVALLSPVGLIYSASKYGQRDLVENVQKAGGWNAYAKAMKKKYGE